MFAELCDSNNWLVEIFLYHQYSVAVAGATGKRNTELDKQGAELNAWALLLLQLRAAGNVLQWWQSIFPGHMALFFLAGTMGCVPRVPLCHIGVSSNNIHGK